MCFVRDIQREATKTQHIVDVEKSYTYILVL